MFCFLRTCTLLYLATPPRITTHPQDLKYVVPGKLVKFTAEVTGTEPLSYQWEWKPAMNDGEWQSCDVERFPGANSPTVTIHSVQKTNEGGYRCVISNCAGNQISKQAHLSVGKRAYFYQWLLSWLLHTYMEANFPVTNLKSVNCC